MSSVDEEKGRPGKTGIIPGSDFHHGRLITARGTEDGLILRIDGRSDWTDILLELRSFLEERKSFIKGGAVAIEWLDRLPTKEQSKELETLLRESYGVEVIGRRKKDWLRAVPCDQDGSVESQHGEMEDFSEIPLAHSEMDEELSSIGKRLDLVDKKRSGEVLTIDNSKASDNQSPKNYIDRMAQILGDDVFYDEDANAKIVFGTLRSGQRVETPYSLIVIGDVNPGADLIAGGDIVVFGSLRGTAHASAYDDDGTERVIVALKMQPMQLRIGSVISRGNDEHAHGPEVARIEDRRIMVDAYNPRATFSRKRR